MDEPRNRRNDGDASGHQNGRGGGADRAPSETHREVAYLKELVQSQAPVVVKLCTGETFSGFVEYYDKRFIRLTRDDGPNLVIFKQHIKYLYEVPPDKPSRSNNR